MRSSGRSRINRSSKLFGIACLSTVAIAGCIDQTSEVSSTPAQVAIQSPSAQASVIPPPTVPAQPFQAPVKPKKAAGYQVETYYSNVFGRDRAYGVVLPPGYNEQPQTRYPVIFLLHGGHGDPTAWFEKGNAVTVVKNLIASQKLPPSIVITPDGNDNRGSSPYWDPQYINGPNGNVMSAIGDELVQVVKSRYRTKPQRDFWAIGGLSSGGWGAMNVGLHYRKNFKTLFSHSGFFVDASGVNNSPMEFVRTLKPEDRQSLAIYVDAGEGDGKYLTESQEFHTVLDQLKIENEFNEFPGGHGTRGNLVGWGFWHRHLADSLSFVGEQFREAEGASSPVSSR